MKFGPSKKAPGLLLLACSVVVFAGNPPSDHEIKRPSFSQTRLVRLPNFNFLFVGPPQVTVRIPNNVRIANIETKLPPQELPNGILKDLPRELVTPQGGRVQFRFGTWDDGYNRPTPTEKAYKSNLASIRADRNSWYAGDWAGPGAEGIDQDTKKPARSFQFWGRRYTIYIDATWPQGNKAAREEAMNTIACVLYSIQPYPANWKPPKDE